MRLTKKIFLIIAKIFIISTLFSQENSYPFYVSGGVPINEYTLFANSGWDGNWYVGYNMCWIKRFKKEFLPPNIEDFSEVYVGVKLGRAKIQQKPNSAPWEKEVIKGKIYVGVSSTTSWKYNQRYFLCETQDIPTEGDWENAITTAGESRWFYTEIPLQEISTDEDLWVCVYSETPYLINISSSPVLAGGWRERKQKDTNVWLNNQIMGTPPIQPENALLTSIRAFDPAIILKFVPKGVEKNVEISVSKITDGRQDTEEKVFFIDTKTPNIERVWMEISQDGTNWKKISRYQYNLPFVFNLNLSSIPHDILGDFYIRFGANDIFENVGYSSNIQLNISRITKETPSEKIKQKKK